MAQANAGELGHVELLAVMCADEAARRDTVGLERRAKAAASSRRRPSRITTSPFNPKVPPPGYATLHFLEPGSRWHSWFAAEATGEGADIVLGRDDLRPGMSNRAALSVIVR